MKKITLFFCVLLCVSMLCACAVDVKPVPAPSDNPAATQEAAPTEVPATPSPEASREPTQELDPTAEPTQAPTEEPARTPDTQEELTDRELDKLLDLVMAAAGGIGPKDGFDEKPRAEQAVRILCAYINHMTNSHLRASGEIRDDMLYMTQDQAEVLYRDLFAGGKFEFADSPELDMKKIGDQYAVPLASGESLIPELKDSRMNPADSAGQAAYTLEYELSREFDPNVKYSCSVVVQRSPESFFGFVIVSIHVE